MEESQTRRRYDLVASPSDHPLRKRPFLHHARESLEARRRLKGSHLHPGHRPLVFAKLQGPNPHDDGNTIDFSAGEPAIRDQQAEGSCGGHQERNVRMLWCWLTTGSFYPADLSPRFGYFTTRALRGEQNADSGISIADGVLALEQSGLSTEALCPYVAGDFADPPSQDAYADGATRTIPCALPVDFSSFSNIVQAMADGYPLIGGFSVPPSFEECGPAGILQDPSGESDLGGHAFSICQVRRSDCTMLDPNSWGTGWGSQGYGRMPASYLDRFLELYAIVPLQVTQI